MVHGAELCGEQEILHRKFEASLGVEGNRKALIAEGLHEEQAVGHHGGPAVRGADTELQPSLERSEELLAVSKLVCRE
jgi:hypothetical protein